MLRKILIGTCSLIALFAIAGSALFFATPSSAQESGAEVIPMQEEDGRSRFNHNRNPEQKLAHIAEALGMTTEALQAELDAGKTILEIAEEQGVELRERGKRRGNNKGRLFSKVDRKAVVAEAIGISVEELEAAYEAGTKLPELVEANGTTIEAVQDAMQAAVTDAINQAVADGELTQERADMILEKMALKALARDIFGKDDMKAAAADALGISVEALEAAREAGTKLPELAEENGTTVAAVKEAVKAAREAAIQAAVEDGTLTQEQADELQSGKKGKRGGKHGGRGRNGGNSAAPIAGDA